MKRIFFMLGMCSFLLSACSDNKEEGGLENNMKLSADACNLDNDKPYGIIDIIEGAGGYKVNTSDEKVAVPYIEEEILYVMGFGMGTATIEITDQNNNSAKVEVIINTEITRPLPLKETVYVKIGNTKKLDAPYDFNHPVAFFGEEYASVFSESSFVHIEGKKVGNVPLYVIKDIWPIHVFDVKVVEMYDLIVESKELSVFIGQDVRHLIIVGNGGYTVGSSDPLIAEAKIMPYEGKTTNSMSNPAIININSLQEGNAIISLKDAEGKEEEIKLEVKI